MRDAAGKDTEAFELGGVPQPLFRLLDFGDVDAGADEAGEAPLRIKPRSRLAG